MSTPGPSSVLLKIKTTTNETEYDRALCIICQNPEDTARLSTGVIGRQSMKRAAETKQDNIYKRIKTHHNDTENSETNTNNIFYYHNTNKCFKSYIQNPKNAQKSDSDQPQIEITETSQKTLRKSITPCEPPSSERNPKDFACTICGCVRHKGIRNKDILCVKERAMKFIKAVKFNQDSVFTRVAHRIRDDEEQCISSFLSADLFHKECIKGYLIAYDRATEIKHENDSPKDCQLKKILFHRALPYFDIMLKNGECCTIKDAVGFAMSLLVEGEVIQGTYYNRDMKGFLTNHYADSIVIKPSNRAYESDIFFSSTISAADIALRLKHQDIMKEAAAKIRDDLIKIDFGLEDSFCDSFDLQDSWEKTRMPESLLTFLSVLYDIPKHKLFCTSAKDLDELVNPLIDENNQTNEKSCDEYEEEKENNWVSDHKSTQLHCLFQMIYNGIHNGRKRTPMHLMMGHSMYARDRSKTLMTTFNRIGVCSSYLFIKFLRKLLASYAIMCSKDDNVPIPSNLNKVDFTMGGTDNSNYNDRSSLSGTEGCNYAAMVLFQAKSNSVYRKPRVSETGITRQTIFNNNALPCQTVPPHNKPNLRPKLPEDMVLHPENCQVELLDIEGSRLLSHKREFAINLVRCGMSTDDPITWQGVHVLISSSSSPLQNVGFLPVIPKPITERATVRHVSSCFQNVRKQLNQSVIPIWADEAVYEHLVELCLSEPEKFKDILPLMGPFHWNRVLLKCQGKYLRGSGVDDALIECSVFGSGVLETVLNGSHFVRSLTGTLIIEDIVMKLFWEEFWKHHNKADYPVLRQVTALQIKLNDNERCSEDFNAIVDQLDILRDDFTKFKLSCEEKSGLCSYLGEWLKMVAVIKNAVVSEREANWNLHCAMVEDSQPIFTEMDSYKYLRYGSYYLETIKVLEFTHPEIYRRFSMGGWVIQEKTGWFIAVGGDMKVEQTTQRVSKGPGGHYVVGQTRKAGAVAEFELLYHEIGSIAYILNFLTTNQTLKPNECHLPPALSKSRRININGNVARFLDYVKNRDNPYSSAFTSASYIPLHHWITGSRCHPDVEKRLLHVLENGEKIYKTYREERIIQKMEKMSAKISRRNLPDFNHQPKNEITLLNTKCELSSKAVAEAQRNMEILKEREEDLTSILSHDLFTVCPLFEGHLPAEANKHTLVSEIEKHMDLSTWNRDTNLKTHVIVDFMSKIRQLPLGKISSIQEAIDCVRNSASSISGMIEIIHFVYDSYIELCLKEACRLRRYNPDDGIELIGMTEKSEFPKQLDKFWGCVSNKEKIQVISRKIHNTNASVVSSSIVINGEVLPALHDGVEIPELLSWVEEGEAHCIPHIEWAIRSKQVKRIIVMSNDTDMFALLVHFMSYFSSIGVSEVWQQYGTGEHRRMLPIHQVPIILGVSKSKALIKAHILSGDDCMSKVGTKHAAVTFDPEYFLNMFGEKSEITEQEVIYAEEYLVKLWSGVKSKTSCKTFDELRLEKYLSGTGIDMLPPTSSTIRGHIYRGFLLIYKAIHLLDREQEDLDPREYGWEENSGIMIPTKFLKHIPANKLSMCSCTGKCNKGPCKCNIANFKCTLFCHIKKNNIQCQNKL